VPDKRFLIAPVALLAFAQANPSPETLTPEGPATLYSDWHGGHTLEGVPAELLTGLRVTVLPGGKGGTVRLLVHHRPSDGGPTGPQTVHAGAPVTLPAEPGTYVFPAPHVLHDYRDIALGIEQQTGGHAIATQTRCTPEDGEGDFCGSQSVDVYRPPIGDAVPDRRTASEIQRGRQLLIEPITELDWDNDGAGDQTEDRTNLRATATSTKLSGGRRAFDVTIENAGPRPANLPRVRASFLPRVGAGTWSPKCVAQAGVFSPNDRTSLDERPCQLAPIAVGERRTVRVVVPDIGRGDAYFSVSAEGPDLAGGDESADADYSDRRPPLWLEVQPRPEFNREGRMGIEVHSARKGTVRLQLQRGNRTWLRRTVTFRRAGGRRVVLRIPRNFNRSGGVATLTARSGTATAKARFEPSY
jgi:hypothetical protein